MLSFGSVMADFGINLSDALAIYRESGKTNVDPDFDIEYRKLDGTYGIKKNVRRAAGKRYLTTSAGAKGKVKSVEDNVIKLHLYSSTGERFEVFICLLVKFNGLTINHKY